MQAGEKAGEVGAAGVGPRVTALVLNMFLLRFTRIFVVPSYSSSLSITP